MELLDEVDASGRRALDQEAARLTEWLGGTRINHRFPSPLMRARAQGLEG